MGYKHVLTPREPFFLSLSVEWLTKTCLRQKMQRCVGTKIFYSEDEVSGVTNYSEGSEIPSELNCGNSIRLHILFKILFLISDFHYKNFIPIPNNI
jgi:hypothetical protein